MNMNMKIDTHHNSNQNECTSNPMERTKETPNAKETQTYQTVALLQKPEHAQNVSTHERNSLEQTIEML